MNPAPPSPKPKKAHHRTPPPPAAERSPVAGALVSLAHPAFLAAIAVAAACVVISVSYEIHDTDLWQLLVVGKAIWTRHAIPTTDEWTWASYGDPQITSSWGFRALIWPLWSAFGAWGLFAYRWISSLAIYGVLWVAARRMGARGFVPLVIVAWTVLVYRLRAEVRPESLAALLVALELLILETWRAGGADRRRWLIVIALVWANVHISYWLGFGVLGAYGIDAAFTRRRAATERNGAAATGAAVETPSAALRTFGWIALACAAVSFLNPFGARALFQPVDFAMHWRHEPMFRNVVELRPVDWRAHGTDGLALLVAAWPLLLLWRWRRREPDVAGLLLCGAFTYLGISSQRFIGLYAIVATPFVARDLQALVEARRWPVWTVAPWARAVLATVTCVAIGAAEWARLELPLGVGLDPALYPAAACDFLERHDVRGRIFNHFHLGGYLAYRAWPGRDRLPFVTTQPENIRPADRAMYLRVFVDRAAWEALDRKYRFQIAVLEREQDPGDRLLDYLDADSTWSMVFADDAAEVLVRRTGPLAPVAERFGYRILPAGIQRRMQVVPAAAQDTVFRAAVQAELERMAESSVENGGAHHMLGIFAMMDGALDDARTHLEHALAKKPFLPKVHELLGVIALRQGRPSDALREFETERVLHGPLEGLEARIGSAQEALGHAGAARRAYQRELEAYPGNAEAQAALARLGR